MTLKKLLELVEKYNIPDNVTLQSDSGWECCATDMEGVYYNRSENIIVFTQGTTVESDKYYKTKKWQTLEL